MRTSNCKSNSKRGIVSIAAALFGALLLLGAVPEFDGDGEQDSALLREQNPRLHFPPVMPLLPQDNYDKPGAVCYPMTPIS